MEKCYRYLTLILVLIALQSCAVIEPLSGGPDDTTPPEVTKVSPENNTLNFRENTLKLKFSEYLDKPSVVENIRLSPKTKMDFSWSGKTLKINLLEPLKPSTTYCLSIEAGYKDLSGNPPLSTQSFIFSTGSSIDSAYISGQADKFPGYSLFAYNLETLNADTLDIRKNEPEYSLKIGGGGAFKLQALPEGKYRIFLVNDRNADGLYNEGSEEIALFTRDLLVSMNNSPKDVVFHKSKLFDFSAPELTEASALDNRSVLAKFNKPIDTNSVGAKAFYLLDSAQNRTSAIAAYIAPKDSQSIVINFPKDMNDNELYQLVLDNAISSIRDIRGNAMKDVAKSETFYGSNKSYMESAFSLTCSLKDSTKDVSTEAKVYINFSRAINQPKMSGIALKQEGKKKPLPIKTELINSNSIAIATESPLHSNTNYKLEVSLKEVKSAFGEVLNDTTISINFTTEDLRLNGSAYGTLKVNGTNIYNIKKYHIILSSADGKTELTTFADSLGNWSFPSLKEGNYTISIGIDENENGIIDYGKVFPYTPAERYIPNAKQIKIAQRWKIDNVIINIDD